MSNSEILGLHRITKKHLRDLCKKHNLYQTPHLNDQLYLHFQGFQSIENLEEYTGLKCLWLESNAISEIQGLDAQTELKCLFLQNNLIKKIENLECCTSLDTLNFSSNHITKIENCGIDILPVLSTLNISRNYLRNSDGLSELLNCKQLWSLDLSHNRIDDILVVKIFAKMPELRVLVLQGNPVVSKVPQYRKTLILECKNLTYLDSRPVFPKDRACAEAWKRGGYEEERKENDRWIRMDRKKIRDSVNAALRLRQTHGAGDCQLLESSDDENDKKDKNKLRQIPKDGTSSGDLELIGVGKKVRTGLSDGSDSSSSTSLDDSIQEPEHKKESEIDASNIANHFEEVDSSHDRSTYNYTKEFEQQLMLEEGFKRDEINSDKIIEDENGARLKEIYKKEEKTLNEPYEDMKIDGSEVDFEIEVISELDKIGSSVENAKTYYENFNLKTGDDVDCESEDQQLIQKSTDLSSSTKTVQDVRDTRLSEKYKIDESFFQKKFEDINLDGRKTDFEISEVLLEHQKIEYKEKNVETHLDTCNLKTEENVDCRGQGSLQNSIEINEENDSSFLSMSTSTDFSKPNESTKSLSFPSSSSSESSVTNSSSSDSANYSYDLLIDVISVQSKTCSQITKETIENKASLLLNNNSEEELEHLKVKAEEYKDQNALDKKSLITQPLKSDTFLDCEENTKTHSENSILEMKENDDCKSEDKEYHQKSIESNKESVSSFLSLSTNSDFSENNESTKSLSSSSSFPSESSSTNNSSSDSETYIDDHFQTVTETVSSNAGLENTEAAIEMNARALLNKDIEEIQSLGGETEKKSVMTEPLTSDAILECSKSRLTDSITGSYKLSSEESKKDEKEYSKISNDEDSEVSSLQKINPPIKSPQILTQSTNLSEPFDDTEARLKKIFENILADEDSDGSLDLSAGTLKEQSQVQQFSNSQRYSNWPSSEDSRDNILSANELNEEQVKRERDNDSIWKDRYWHLEDTNATNWLDSFLIKEVKKETSPSKRLVEEIDNNNSCLALYDSTEDTVASEWLEQFLDGEELKQHAKEVIEEFENCFNLERPPDLDQQIKENSGHSAILEETTEFFERSKLLNEDLNEDFKEVESLNRQVYEGDQMSKENENKIKIEQENEQISTEIEPINYFEAVGNYENSPKDSISRDDENDHKALFWKNKENCKTNSEDGLLEYISHSSSWWERTLAAAHEKIPKEALKEIEDSFENIKKGSETFKSAEEREVFDQSEIVPTLENRADASNFLERILEEIIHNGVEAPPKQGTVLSTETLKLTKQDAEVTLGSQNSADRQKSFNILEEKIPIKKVNLESEENPHFEEDNSSSASESFLEDPSSVSTLRETVTTFNEVVKNISSRNRQKSQLLKELIYNPLTTTFTGQSGEEINRQVEELKHQKQEQLLNYVDCVYAQRVKYDDTLDVVNGRLMVVKRSTGALQELPPPPPPPSLSQGAVCTKFVSCGVSTTPTSCKDDDDGDSDECGTALSEDNDNDDDDDDDDEEEDDIEQHASDTKIKSILNSSCDVNYCASESVSLSWACSSTEIEKKEHNNHHHHLDDVFDDSQQRAAALAAGKLHNEIDSEVLPGFRKWLPKEQAPPSSASGPADYKLPSKEMTEEGGEGVRTQTRSEFQVELNDSIHSFMDFGENESASLEDIALIFENFNAGE